MENLDNLNIQIVLERGMRHYNAGRPADAIATFAEVLRHTDSSPRQHALAAFNRATIRAHFLDRVGAIEDFGLMIDQPDGPPPLHCVAWLHRGVYRFLLGDHAGAICDLTACMNFSRTLHDRLEMAKECGFSLADSMTPARLRARAGWMRAYARWYLTDYDGASSDCLVVIRTDGIKPAHTAGAHAVSGLINLVNSNFSDAALAFRQAQRLGGHVVWQAMLGLALLGANDFQGGMSEFSQAMTSGKAVLENLEGITALLDRIERTALPINGISALRKILSDRTQHVRATQPDPQANRFRRLRSLG